jgi:hypothetical protein
MALFIFYLRYMIRQKTTELSHAVEKLRESEERTKSLLSANPDYLLSLTVKGTSLITGQRMLILFISRPFSL